MKDSQLETNRLYRSPNRVRVIKSRRLRWARHVARMGDSSVFKIVTGKPTEKRPPGRSRRRWKRILEWILKKRG